MQVTTGPAGLSAFSVTATLNYTISSGQFTITGTFSFANTSCLPAATLPLQSATFQDPKFTLDVPTSNGTFHLFGSLPDATTLAAQFEIRGGTCDGASGTGTLTKQTAPVLGAGIRFSFKLDPRLQGGTYGGDVWVLPPTFTAVGFSDTCVVESRAHGVDSAGVFTDISAIWTPDNPAMVAVSPSEGHQVTITVRAIGTSNLQVSVAGSPTKLLFIEAVKNQNNVLVCSLTQ